ncbi:sensor histidine kinase, partial [Streptococcus agalactiae]
MRGYRMEERFKKRLQDDISKHFSRQSLILSLLLIALFVLFSLAPQQIGLYKDVNSVSYSYKQLIQKHDTLLDDLGKNSLKPFVSGHLGSADLSKQYYHLRNHLQSQTELLVFSPNQELLFASNSHLGNFFSKSIYISEVLDKAKINQRLLKIIVDSEGGHYLA